MNRVSIWGKEAMPTYNNYQPTAPRPGGLIMIIIYFQVSIKYKYYTADREFSSHLAQSMDV